MTLAESMERFFAGDDPAGCTVARLMEILNQFNASLADQELYVGSFVEWQAGLAADIEITKNNGVTMPKPSEYINQDQLAFALWNKYADPHAGDTAKSIIRYLDMKDGDEDEQKRKMAEKSEDKEEITQEEFDKRVDLVVAQDPEHITEEEAVTYVGEKYVIKI